MPSSELIVNSQHLRCYVCRIKVYSWDVFNEIETKMLNWDTFQNTNIPTMVKVFKWIPRQETKNNLLFALSRGNLNTFWIDFYFTL